MAESKAIQSLRNKIAWREKQLVEQTARIQERINLLTEELNRQLWAETEKEAAEQGRMVLGSQADQAYEERLARHLPPGARDPETVKQMFPDGLPE